MTEITLSSGYQIPEHTLFHGWESIILTLIFELDSVEASYDIDLNTLAVWDDLEERRDALQDALENLQEAIPLADPKDINQTEIDSALKWMTQYIDNINNFLAEEVPLRSVAARRKAQ